MSVYGMVVGNITEKSEPAPNTHYGRSKLQAEEIITAMSSPTFKVAIIRPPMVYGKGCRGNYNLLAKMALKLPIFPRVDNKRSMIYVDNLCEFLRQIIDNRENGFFFPQNNEYVNTTKMAEYICLCNNKKIRVTSIFNWVFILAKRFTSIFEKAFGSLTYDRKMSEYKSNYCVCDFEQSIKDIENHHTM